MPQAERYIKASGMDYTIIRCGRPGQACSTVRERAAVLPAPPRHFPPTPRPTPSHPAPPHPTPPPAAQFASRLPPLTLRDALLRTCGHSAELFLARRGAYTASLTACCAFGYVAGVGDRHTSNFLLQVRVRCDGGRGRARAGTGAGSGWGGPGLGVGGSGTW